MSDIIKDTTRLLAAAITGQDAEPTPEQIEATKEMLARESVVRRMMPPTPVADDDPFLKECQKLTGDDQSVVLRNVFPIPPATTLFEADYAGMEIDMQRHGMVPFSLFPLGGRVSRHPLDKLCVVCRGDLTGTGYRQTDRGPAHVTCLEPPKPKEPFVPPEVEG